MQGSEKDQPDYSPGVLAMAGNSKLLERLARYHNLTDADRSAIASLEQRERQLRRGERLIEAGGTCDRIFIVRDGALASFVEEQGQMILALFFPGDVIDLLQLCKGQRSCGILCLSNCSVAELESAEFGKLFADSALLVALIYTLMLLDYTLLLDRTCAVGRMSARNRILLILLQIASRIRSPAGSDTSTRFELPLTQQQLASAAGISAVHVSKVLAAIEADGLIRRSGRTIWLLDESRMRAACDFKDRYANLDLSWLGFSRLQR